MMNKFHLVAGEPKPCKAEIQCPVGGDHYPDEASARKAFEKENKNNTFNNLSKSKRTLKGDVKRIGEKLSTPKGMRVAGVAVTGTLVAGGFAAVGSSGGNDFAKTPYGVSVNVADTGSQPYSGYVVGANLKHSEFKECSPNYNKSGSASSVSCKTVDGKFVVTSQPSKVNESGRSYQSLSNMTVKDSNTNKEVFLKHSKTDGTMNLFTPKASVNK